MSATGRIRLLFVDCRLFTWVQGDPSACKLRYVDISSNSYGGYPETELMTL